MGKKKTVRGPSGPDLAVAGHRVTAPACAPGYAPTSRAAKATKRVPIAPGQTVELVPTGCAPKKTKAAAPTRADAEAAGWDEAWAHEVLARAVYYKRFFADLDTAITARLAAAPPGSPARAALDAVGERVASERKYRLEESDEFLAAADRRLGEICARTQCRKTPAEVRAAAARYGARLAAEIISDLDRNLTEPPDYAAESAAEMLGNRVQFFTDLRSRIYTRR